MQVSVTFRFECPDIGAHIRRARLNQPKSITKLAAEADMSVANWYRIEQERSTASLKGLRRMEAALGVDLGIPVPAEIEHLESHDLTF